MTDYKPIFAGRNVVGQVQGNTFYKTITGSKHMLHKPPALCFDCSTLTDAVNAGADRVQVTDRETGRTYAAKIATIQENGFAVNRGYGAQIALPLTWFSVDGKPPMSGPVKPKPEPQAVQARLL